MTREEAIKIVQSATVWTDEEREALAMLIPELAESEDERIRKEISTLYADIDSCISELLAARTNKDAEAEGKALFRMEGLMVATLQDLSCVEDWLEKQKDASKAIEAVDRIDKYIDDHLANAHDMKDSNPDKKYYRGWDDALGKMAGILQDVYSEKENKFAPRVLPCSAAWFEDGDEKQKYIPKFEVSDRLISTKNPRLTYKILEVGHINELGNVEYKAEIFTDGKPDEPRNVHYMECRKVDKWAEKQKEQKPTDDVLHRTYQEGFNDGLNYRLEGTGVKYVKDNPKQEWSEEDEKILQSIIKDFRAGKVSTIGQEQWLKSLHPQPKAELTLLDENIINAAVAFVEQNNHFNYWGGIDKRTVIKALRSLKPHWKPSEEQMKAMSYFVRKHQATANRATTKWPEFEAFKSLYNDLKKLL